MSASTHASSSRRSNASSVAIVTPADGTRVTWFEDGALPGVLGGLQAGPVGDAMTKLHEDRLAKLKALAEGEQSLKP